MGQRRPELVYEDVEGWRAEEEKRADPRSIEFRKAGTKRRTSFRREALVDGGPDWLDGKRTAWFVVIDQYGNTEFIPVTTATELANLPSNALAAEVYAHQVAEEDPSLADSLFCFLSRGTESHRAHHTAAADIGSRLRAISQLAQLEYLVYQDPEIGQGISVPPILHRRVNPATLVGADGVTW